MRTRSGVGRKPSTSGNLSKRLRQTPALMRTWLVFADLEGNDFGKIRLMQLKPYFNLTELLWTLLIVGTAIARRLSLLRNSQVSRVVETHL